MQNKRCFLCGHKMLSNGLCSNVDCIRNTPVPSTIVANESETEKETENTKTQGE